MKHSIILKQHIPYAAMISKDIDFCEMMLTKTNTLYPFAVFTFENDMQCVFTPSKEQDASAGMIQELENRIFEYRIYTESAVSLLVYNATVSESQCTPKMTQRFPEETEALVLTITDSTGNNTVTIYPYVIVENKIELGNPYTCDFSD